MTEDSQNGVRGYGPFQEGAEPTERITPQSAGAPPAEQPPIPAQTTPSAPDPGPATQPTSGGPGAATPPTSGGPYAGTPPTSGGPYAGTPPTSGRPYAGTPPTSGGPYAATPPTSGGPYAATPPTSGGPYAAAPATPYPGPDDTPTSASPYGGPSPTSPSYGTDPTSGDPTSGPTSGGPTSGGPYSYGPFHGSPTPLHEGWNPANPTSASPVPEDPYGLAPSSFSGRRIEPTPPPDRNRMIIGIVAGLVAGLLVFGTGGWFAGRASTPDVTSTQTAATPPPSSASSLGVFEQSQVAINEPHFANSGLTAIAQGWLPYLSSCSRSGSPSGPNLNEGEKVRVRCTLDGMSALFVEYNSIADRDKARVRTLGQNVDARSLTPGVGAAEEKPTPSGRTTGNYVEYAYKLTEGSNTRIVSGIWWDDAQTPIAAYLLAFWKEGLGERWEPMRDLWSRYA